MRVAIGPMNPRACSTPSGFETEDRRRLVADDVPARRWTAKAVPRGVNEALHTATNPPVPSPGGSRFG